MTFNPTPEQAEAAARVYNPDAWRHHDHAAARGASAEELELIVAHSLERATAMLSAAANAAPAQVDEAKLAEAMANELETDDAIVKNWSSGKLAATSRRLVQFAVLPVLRGGAQ